MTTKTAIKTQTEYACVQLDVDRFSPDYEFEITTYDDGTTEIAYGRWLVWEGASEDVPHVDELVFDVHHADPYDFADDYEWREDR